MKRTIKTTSKAKSKKPVRKARAVAASHKAPKAMKKAPAKKKPAKKMSMKAAAMPSPKIQPKKKAAPRKAAKH